MIFRVFQNRDIVAYGEYFFKNSLLVFYRLVGPRYPGPFAVLFDVLVLVVFIFFRVVCDVLYKRGQIRSAGRIASRDQHGDEFSYNFFPGVLKECQAVIVDVTHCAVRSPAQDDAVRGLYQVAVVLLAGQHSFFRFFALADIAKTNRHLAAFGAAHAKSPHVIITA